MKDISEVYVRCPIEILSQIKKKRRKGKKERKKEKEKKSKNQSQIIVLA